jgi:hypothetical protein
VKKWKAEVDREKASRGDAGKAGPGASITPLLSTSPVLLNNSWVIPAAKKAGSKSGTPAPTTPVTAAAPKLPPPKATPAAAAKPTVRTAKSDGVKMDILGDKTRDKCMELIYDALALDSGYRTSFDSFALSRILTFLLLTQRPTSSSSAHVQSSQQSLLLIRMPLPPNTRAKSARFS